MCQSNLFQFGEDEEKEGREEGMTVRGDGGGLPRFNWPALACYSEVSMMPSLNICRRLHADTTSRSTVGNLTATGLTANIWVSPVSTHLFKCRIQPLPPHVQEATGQTEEKHFAQRQHHCRSS